MKHFDFCREMTRQRVKIVTKTQLAKALGVSEATIYRMIKRHQLPTPLRTPQGYTRGWLRATLDDWFQNITNSKGA
ncbi:helix-turn-helix transcriptional regulator [Vibrio marisflavi]|uniref:Helix-turn-helix domain-containing protein n=1 Tax=Vibrio marisflavi CECT 7928 TaxID=634439 RepID=A0ABM9A7Y3_9VIBR|nr:helix-turn-helix domain-containing protein [Vibrio marisflavi]CAH0541814.1 hypothetical protein VMF7928_03859 [Vibrio marisflavi CECT 7928]